MVLHSFQWNYQGSDVKVTGDFDNWTASTEMQRNAEGHFVKVVDLPANSKVYYKFVVDGNWCVDGQALKEGEGAHENNYILTGAHPATGASEKTLSAEPTAPLPVLGHAAAYTSTETAPTAAAESSYVEPPKSIVHHPSQSIVAGGYTTAPESAVVGKETHYDDSGPSPSDPQAVRNARDNPLAEAYNEAVENLPTREEIVHEVQHAAEVAGGFLAAGLAAGAAAFGLSNATTHTEKSPITGSTATTTSSANETSDITNTIKSALTSAVPASVTEKVVPKTSAQVSQTGTLEQTAVAAATSAATNAYNASGLTGLGGVTAPVASLSKDGSVGFTGIGTAVNQETGVVGTSKIVQGVNDVKATEETHTAQFPSETAGALLQDHANGAKVERISEHAVLAEVGIGGAAIGTAVVTDGTVSSSQGLSIPAQAAEHLPATDAATVVAAAAASSRTVESRPVAVTVDSGLAPALSRDAAPVEALTTREAPMTEKTLLATPAAELPSTTTAASAVTPAEASTVTPAVAAVDGARPETAATRASGATSYETAKTSEAAATPASPSKAAAQAASKSSTMRQNARSQFNSESTVDEGKKKRGLLKRMKSIFNSKQK